MKYTLIYKAVALVVFAGLSACGQKPAEESKTSPFQPTASIQEIMNSIIDTNADEVWNSVATISTKEGTEERSPHTDEEWLAVRRHAITLLEASNLLVVEGRQVAVAGSSTSKVPAEATAEVIQKNINAHRPEFIAHANALHSATKEAIAAIDAKNTEELVRIGGKIDQACESCHARFWYPGEKLPVFPRLEKHEAQKL